MSQANNRNGSRSARRADGSLLSTSRTPQSEDFFTDSLLDASSKIPSPSPNKIAFSQAYHGRRAIGNTRALRAAWEASGPKSRRNMASDGDLVGSSLQLPVPTSAVSQPTDLSPSRQIINKTPSPPTTRHSGDLTSPFSDVASPPKGLNDTYQRIADEEDLAAQEGEIDEEEDSPEDILPVDDSDRHLPLIDHLRQSGSPSSMHGSHRSIPQPFTGHRNKESLANDEITSLSEASGMSFLQQLTDQQLAAKLTPHTRDRAQDRARVEKLMSSAPAAITKSHPERRSRLTSDNLRENGYLEDAATNGSSSGSVRTEHSEPPPNVPRSWMRRPRTFEDRLHRRNRRDGRDVPAAHIRGSTRPDSPNIDWMAIAAHNPVPAEDPPPRDLAPLRDTTNRALHPQSAFDKMHQWEINDFTGHSLQVSNSPPIRIRTNISDQMREKEIKNLEKQAVTTNRLGEIRKKDSNELIRTKSRTSSSTSPVVDAPKAALSSSAIIPADKSLGDELAEGERIPNTPVVVFRTSDSLSGDDQREREYSRPAQDRKFSQDRLQRLAKVMSSSSQGSPPPEDWSLIGKEEGVSPAGHTKHGQYSLPSGNSRISSGQVANVESTPHSAKEPNDAKTPVVTGAWTDTILPDTVKATKKIEIQQMYTQTPHVGVGGWIDTPIPGGKRHSSSFTPVPLERVPEELTNGIGNLVPEIDLRKTDSRESDVVPKPDALPKSALAGLLSRAKQRLVSQDIAMVRECNDTLNLGDATIESLEDLLTLDAADMTTLIRLGAEADVREGFINDDNTPMAEAELLERLGSKLERLQTNIHDARKGISKLEHQVSHPDPKERTTKGTLGWQPASTEYKVYLVIPLPRLWNAPRKDLNQWFPRLTTVGWITFTIWTWYFSECIMCEFFGHPLYAERYVWPNEPEPLFPWALPTMLWRWSGIRSASPALLGPLWTLLVAFGRIAAQMLGLSDGFVDIYDGAMGRGTAAAGLGVSSSTSSIAPEFGLEPEMMNNDEYI